jgi:RNA 2',3'-cyclic 3'-phosphodiesterase
MEYPSRMSVRTVQPAAQSDLFGQTSATHAETHRLFFALMPDDPVRERISAAATWLEEQHPELRARWVKPERFHATLKFMGDYPELPMDEVEKAKSAADKLSASPFDWTLDYAASFRGREPPCVLRSTVVPQLLMVLWQNLGKTLSHAGLPLPVERQFTPHVTLAYGKRELTGATLGTPISWHVRHFVLIHNVVGKGNYQVLGNWPLSA